MGEKALAGARLTIEWSMAALADLDRFASFLHKRDPRLAFAVARAIIDKSNLIAEQPEVGRQFGPRNRRLVVRVLSASYEIRYCVEDNRIVMLRVFHGLEDR